MQPKRFDAEQLVVYYVLFLQAHNDDEAEKASEVVHVEEEGNLHPAYQAGIHTSGKEYHHSHQSEKNPDQHHWPIA